MMVPPCISTNFLTMARPMPRPRLQYSKLPLEWCSVSKVLKNGSNTWGRSVSAIPAPESATSMVAGWPADFDARRAAGLGFVAESGFDEIIRAHIEDECGGKL